MKLWSPEKIGIRNNKGSSARADPVIEFVTVVRRIKRVALE